MFLTDIRRLLFLLFLMLFGSSVAVAQRGFKLPAYQKKDIIKFELVNNLVIVPVEVNGTELSFLLDTGVNSTILFSVDDVDSLTLKNAVAVKLKGLGKDGSVDAFRSEGNTITVGDATDLNHAMYIVLDQKINFSTRMGIPVHGILGFEFFRRFVVKTDYRAKRLTIYDPKQHVKPKCRKCRDIPIKFHRNKPFIKAPIRHGQFNRPTTLLVDSGSSDGLWLFDESAFITESPKNYFNDFLGMGLSGRIFGKRAKIASISMDDIELKRVTASFPDSVTVQNMKYFEERDGSLGGAILKRFTVTIDYPRGVMTLKKNSNFNEPFYYNMSGLTLEHDGMIAVKEVDYFEINPMKMIQQNREAMSIFDVYKSPTLQFFLAPKFKVAEVVPGSPAALADIRQGDEVVSINGKESYEYKLYEISALFSSKVGKTIYMKIIRNGIVMRKRFDLKEVI